MNKKLGLFLLGIAIALFNVQVKSQDLPTLGLMFSQTNPAGSARILGLGGAQISLGGDLSSAQSNPAGLGMFNRSSFGFSTGLSFINANSNYYGTSTSDLKLNANIPNFGVVLQKDGENKIRSHVFGLSYNRTADYQSRFEYEGRNAQSSMLDYFIQQADGTYESDFLDEYSGAYNSLEGLAVQTGVILPTSYFDPNNGVDYLYDSDILGNPYQTERVTTRGARYQFNIAYGMNYNDVLYLGANIGIASVDYRRDVAYSESDFSYVPVDANDTYENPLNSFRLEEDLKISGGGVNTTLGLMYRPLDFLQIGVAYTSPTYMELEEEFDRSMSVDYRTFDDAYAESDIILANYSLTTPMKLSGGMTFFAGKFGFISADAEMVDYSQSKFRSSDFSTTNDNSEIRSSYEKVYNYRIGGEFRYDIFRIRGGYGLSYNGSTDNNTTEVVSGGAGIRMKHFSFDFAWFNTLRNYDYSPYPMSTPDRTPVVNVFENVGKLVTTVGIYF